MTVAGACMHRSAPPPEVQLALGAQGCDLAQAHPILRPRSRFACEQPAPPAARWRRSQQRHLRMRAMAEESAQDPAPRTPAQASEERPCHAPVQARRRGRYAVHISQLFEQTRSTCTEGVRSAGAWQPGLHSGPPGRPGPRAWLLAHARALTPTRSMRDQGTLTRTERTRHQGGRSRRTGGREEERVDGVVAAAAAAQLHAPAGLQCVQVSKARAPRRKALRHAADRPRRVQHLRAGGA